VKIFKFTWENGLWTFVPAETIIQAFNDLIDNRKLNRMKSFDEVNTMTMAEIANRVNLSVEQTIFKFRGLLGEKKLGEGLLEVWVGEPEEHILPLEHVWEFIRRIEEQQAKVS